MISRKETNPDSQWIQQVIHGTYYPHIDGLRTFAVIPVVLYHLLNSLCPGGFAGVDVFFVISGYLISGGLIKNLQQGHFSFTSFYYRRIKRIMPAYFAMILATLCMGAILFSYRPMYELANAALRSSFFTANFFFYKFTSGYFGQDGSLHPLLNLWSLSVEEQFYIFIPLILFLLWKTGKKVLTGTLVLLFLGSLIYSTYLLEQSSSRSISASFFMLQSRAWELLAGTLLSLLPAIHKTNRWHNFASFFGLILLLFPYIVFTNKTPFPGPNAIPSIVGTALLIRYGTTGLIHSVLSWRPIVGIGKISYSLYLWHWPLIVFWKYCLFDQISWIDYVSMGLSSLLLAYLSWKYIECPIRISQHLSTRKAFSGFAVGCICLSLVSCFFYKTDGARNYLHHEANQYASLNYPPKLQAFNPSFGIDTIDGLKDNKGKAPKIPLQWLGKASFQPSFVLIGDSHAEAIAAGLDLAARETEISGLMVNLKSCPLWGVNETNSFSNISKPFIKWLKKSPAMHTVIVCCRWATRCEGNDVSKDIDHPLPGNQILFLENTPVPPDTSSNRMLFEQGLRELCNQIKKTGRKVVLIGPIPELLVDPGEEIRKNIILGGTTIKHEVTEEQFMKRQKNVIAILNKLEQDKLAVILWIHPKLNQNGIYKGFMKNKLIYHDNTHLSETGAHYVAPLFLNLFSNFTQSKIAHQTIDT